MNTVQLFKTLIISALFLILSGCASARGMQSARSQIASIWDSLTAQTDKNEAQDIKLSRIERSMIRMSIPEDMLFPAGSTRLNHRALGQLDTVAKVLREYSDVKLVIHGHTDDSGPESLNLKLSQRRAQNVANALVERGVKKENIVAIGRGESFPIASNSTASGRRQNRRAEITIATDETEPSVRAQFSETDKGVEDL